MKYEPGQEIKFTASKSNTGSLSMYRNGNVTQIKKNGKPVIAGDIVAGETITVNRLTGEIE